MNLLFEIGTEELPAGEIDAALAAMAQHIVDGAASERLPIGGIETFATPRRLAIRVHDVADVATTVEETVLGPAARIAFDADGNPTKAALGFARGKGLAPEQLLRIETDKGEYVGAIVRTEGRAAADILSERLQTIFAAIPWKRSMKWGWGDETFARPVHWIVALLDDAVLPVSFAGVQSGRESMGHRFLANHTVSIPSPDAYEAVLREAHVVASIEARKQAIVSGLDALVADNHHRGLRSRRRRLRRRRRRLEDHGAAQVRAHDALVRRREERALFLRPRVVKLAGLLLELNDPLHGAQ